MKYNITNNYYNNYKNNITIYNEITENKIESNGIIKKNI